MDIQNELAVQSFCFRHFKSNEEVAQKVVDCGLSNLELCAAHADFTDESSFESILDTYTKHGVNIVSIGVQSFSNDSEKEEKFFKFAQMAGARTISASFTVDSIPDSFRAAETLADKYDINLAIHNHGGHHWLGSIQMLRQVFKDTSPRIGLMLDTAWALAAHEDPVKMAEIFSDRLYGLHYKDFIFDRAGCPEDVVVGTGNLDLPALIAVLEESHFSGTGILEYEGDIENPVPALLDCVKAIEEVS